jgi:hypothetical protein
VAASVSEQRRCVSGMGKKCMGWADGVSRRDRACWVWCHTSVKECARAIEVVGVACSGALVLHVR